MCTILFQVCLVSLSPIKRHFLPLLCFVLPHRYERHNPLRSSGSVASGGSSRSARRYNPVSVRPVAKNGQDTNIVAEIMFRMGLQLSSAYCRIVSPS